MPALGNLSNDYIASIKDELLHNDTVGIFSLPPTLNCNAMVTAVKYCYAGPTRALTRGVNLLLFTLLTLKQEGLNFTIIDTIDIYSTSMNCSSVNAMQYCCNTLALGLPAQFPLPKSNFSFGIVSILPDIIMLQYSANFFPNFQVDQYNIPKSTFGIRGRGNTFNLTDANLVADQAMRTLQFVMSKIFD